MKKYWKDLFHVSVPLVVSLVLYVLFRSKETVVNLLLSDYLPDLQMAFEYKNYNWIIYSLPGALWLYAFLYINSAYSSRIRYSLLPLCFALGIEILQLVHLTDGTFDPLDVILYLLVWLVFVISLKFYCTPTLKIERRLNYRIAFSFFLCIVFLSDVWIK